VSPDREYPIGLVAISLAHVVQASELAYFVRSIASSDFGSSGLVNFKRLGFPFL
jgi:hypothetical protein